jgi:AAA15 family ATPase/GTPase
MKTSFIEFNVANFKIFKEKISFSMITRKSNHTFENNGEYLLRTSLIYGPNASGKSTLFEALHIMKNLILKSTDLNDDDKLPHLPFLFSDKTENQPSFMEIVFSSDNRFFRYNFSILKDKVIEENLYEVLSNGDNTPYLVRKGQEIELFGEFEGGEDLKSKTKEKYLFLSVAEKWNNSLAVLVVQSIRNINVIKGVSDNSDIVIKFLKDGRVKKDRVINLLKKADFFINDFNIKEEDVSGRLKTVFETLEIKKEKIDRLFSVHEKFNESKDSLGGVEINFSDESFGTKSFFSILGPIIDTLDNGRVLFIDEFDSSLHPLLTKFIIDLFEKSNPNNAQLIVTTHDTSLLSYKDDFDKDQFWFTEKDKYGAGNLFCLDEFDIRNDTEYSKKYLEGRFGALPNIDFLDDYE